MAPLIRFTSKGIYCPQADVYIDPWKSVDKALITHAHADHARRGHKGYLCHHHSINILKYRLGNINVQGIEYEKTININGVTISFHPAGHVVGSAQIKLQNNKESWVISGDYKIENDNLSVPFQPVTCDYFITESTFGLPVFQWEDQRVVMDKINKWWSHNKEQKVPSLISAYSLGKAQRLIQNVDHSIGPVLCHPAIANTNEAIIASGIKMKESHPIGDNYNNTEALFICPPAAIDSLSKKLGKSSVAIASGWMALRGARRRRNVEHGFVLSDHADWAGLNQAIRDTGAQKVYVTHGYSDIFSKWLNEKGIPSQTVETAFEGEKMVETEEV